MRVDVSGSSSDGVFRQARYRSTTNFNHVASLISIGRVYVRQISLTSSDDEVLIFVDVDVAIKACSKTQPTYWSYIVKCNMLALFEHYVE
jgi:hypothetical protein